MSESVVAETEPAHAGEQKLFGSALTLYFVLLLTTLISLMVDWDELTSAVVISVTDAVVVFLWAVVSWRAIVPGLTKWPSLGWILGAAGLAFITFGVATVVIRTLTAAFDAEEILFSPPFRDAGHGLGLIILVICVQPAVVEEIAFRGVVLSGMKQVLNTKEAIIVSSLLFMTIHLTVLSFPHLFLMGLVMGYLRVRTESFYPCMILHFTHNLLCVLGE